MAVWVKRGGRGIGAGSRAVGEKRWGSEHYMLGISTCSAGAAKHNRQGFSSILACAKCGRDRAPAQQCGHRRGGCSAC